MITKERIFPGTLALLISVLLTVKFAGPLMSSETSFTQQEVTFQNGSISLAGRLYLPKEGRNLPAVIFTHGSGPSGRDNPRYATEAEFLANHQIAVLLYDKRGVGGSTGDWKKASFEDLAADAGAAFHYLQTRKEIAGNKIGFRGASQSGYILPITAAREKNVAFLILLSPPMVKPDQQILFEVESQLQDKKFSKEDISKALHYTRSGLSYARSGEGWERYVELLQDAQKQRWFEIAGGPDQKDDWMFSFFHKILDFDVIPYLEKTKCPVLVFFAGHDMESPVPIAKPLIEQTLRKRGGTYRIVFYADANHDLRVGKELAEGYLDTLSGWILQTTHSAR
jgi:pimeloyl-ACP methyl ester carboxylesterase